MTSDRPDVSVAVDAAIALMAPICLTQDVALALDAVREMARLAEQRAFEEGQNSMMRSLREARRERDEAREQVRSLTTRVDQMETAYRQAEEAVRSLTVERDHLAMVVEQRKAAGASYREALEKIGTDANDLRGRLSRAREALADFDEEQPHYRDGKEAEDNWRARQESALVALRAALAEPLGGDA